MAALSADEYTAHKKGLLLPSSGLLPRALLDEFGHVQARSHRIWRFLKNGKKRSGDHLPDKIPES
jgi:hypothetical protein